LSASNFIKDLKVERGCAPSDSAHHARLPVRQEMERWAREAVLKVAGITEVRINMTSAVPGWPPLRAKQAIEGL